MIKKELNEIARSVLSFSAPPLIILIVIILLFNTRNIIFSALLIGSITIASLITLVLTSGNNSK